MSGNSDDRRTQVVRGLWAAGDYDAIARMFEPVSSQLVAELDLNGRDVLDAATGTGNTALAAARAGARVWAFDITPELLAIAGRRAEQAALVVSLAEGDLVAMPYADDSFDVVTSTFGAFATDDPKTTAAELVRVCRPGGLIASTAWSGEGMVGSINGVVRARHPELFDPDSPDPHAWARPADVEEIFAGLAVDLDLTQRWHAMEFASLETAWEFMQQTSGTVQRTRHAVEKAGGDWQALGRDVVEAWRPYAEPAGNSGAVSINSRYGLLHATIRGSENRSQ